MIQEVLSGLYRMEIPLPHNPLREINSYLIKGPGRFLIIDTGMNREECQRVMDDCLRQLGVDLERTDFFITHMHADHLGLVSSLARDTSTVYFNRPDAAVVNDPGYWDRIGAFARMAGFSEADVDMAIGRHPGRMYRSDRPVEFSILKEGDRVEIGDYSFRCIETPGHTRGHICLYEAGKRILVSGDHILGDITPNISLWTDDRNPLQEYLESLDKVSSLDVRLVLPGHRSTLTDLKKRIEELKRHHQARADEVLSILEKGRQNAVQIASQMTWDMTYKSWEEFPIQQKWFATGEAIAHLKYLEEQNKVVRGAEGGKLLFALR